MYPFALCHGIAPFDRLLASSGWNAYFKHIPDHLASHGIEAVYEPRVDFAASVADRAEVLAAAIRGILDEQDARKIHLIAHSMGGLDARVAIVDHALGDRVATLTTIGTPHLGTSFADWGLAHSREAIDRLQPLGIDLTGFRDLSIKTSCERGARLERFEADNPVQYVAWASWQVRDAVFAPLQFSWQIIHDAEGRNDGLVPAESQLWTGASRERTGAVQDHSAAPAALSGRSSQSAGLVGSPGALSTSGPRPRSPVAARPIRAARARHVRRDRPRGHPAGRSVGVRSSPGGVGRWMGTRTPEFVG